jgi:ABC-type nitrate/sulfonate/bicarbonate transport system permease component
VSDVLDRRTVLLARIGFGLLVVGTWWALSAMLGSLFLASPADVVSSAARVIGTGEFFDYLLPSLKILAIGASLGLLVGIPVGLLIGRSKRLYWLTEAPINIFYSTPLVALIPFLLVIIGFNDTTKIFIVWLFTVLPALINTASGVRTVDRDLVELSHSFCAGEWALWRDILIPTALPGIITGIRVGFIHALTGVVLADFYAGASGLGYMIMRYSNRFDVATALVPVLFLALVGAVSIVALKGVQRRIAPWQVVS